MGEPRFSRPAMVTPWGKCTEPVKSLIPEETLQLMTEHAARCRTTPAEIIRNMLLEKYHGAAMVEASLIAQFRSTVETGPGKPELCDAAFFGVARA